MLEGQDVPDTLVLVHRSDRTAIPRLSEVEACEMLAATLTPARVACGAFQPVRVRENVKPNSDSNALAQVGSATVPDA